MKDLRIVTVPWNVEKLLERCLLSLPEACRGLDWDIVVVDNNSKDGSVAKAREMANSIARQEGRERVHVIANPDNRGFAKACNQGIADSDARYVLLLNPDTESPPGSLTALVRAADERPQAGIIGPRLVYPDGRYQESVRRFPTFLGQAGILLKLHHLFPTLPFFKRYFARDIDIDAEQSVDQVMGACFLIRREVIEQLGGLDERYFIWFEEVDYCRMAKNKDWQVVYLPRVTVIHHGGQSFAQVFSLRKQKMFDESLIKYFKKWQPGWRPFILSLVHHVAVAEAWFVEIRQHPDRQWIYWLTGTILFEGVSLLTVFHPIARGIVTILAGLMMLVLAYKRPSLGMAFLFLELLIGSKGALTKIPHGYDVDGGISLRIVLTTMFFAGWGIQIINRWRKSFTEAKQDIQRWINGRWSWLALFLLVGWGIVRGLWLKNPFLWQDANAWGFLVLLFPVIDIAKRDGERLLRYALQAAIAGLIWLPLKVLGLLYIFSHGLSISEPIYLWLRRTGVGEATWITGNLFRLFLQSQVYAVMALLFGASWLLNEEQASINKEPTKKASIIVTLSFSSLAISLSRSLSIGLVLGGLFLLFASYASGLWKRLAKLFFLAVAGLLVLIAVIRFPLPPVQQGSLATLFSSRTSTEDVASRSRWNLLPVMWAKIQTTPVLGSGFGATVTYTSQDPRVVQATGGTYTTYAFEWGWLEHWIKLGLLGIPIMVWLLVSIVKKSWNVEAPLWIRLSFISAVIALGALHFFTPYLNHPLGFGILLATEAWIEVQRSVRAQTITL